MRNLKTGLLLLTAGLLFATSCEKDSGLKPDRKGPVVNNTNTIEFVIQNSCGGELTADLFAGKNTKVGNVKVTRNGDNLNVTYKTLPGWMFTETHLSVTASLAEVPTSGGTNPIPGLFAYSQTHEPPVQIYTYENIPVERLNQVYVLAHSVVKSVLSWQTSLSALETLLPETATLKVTYPTASSSSYFTSTLTDGGILNGTYPGWCIDLDAYIYQNTAYTVKVISSYDPEFGGMGLVEHPENMDKVNWILNQNYVGKTAPDGNTYTFSDVQRAIWALIEDQQSTNGLYNWSQARVDAILTEANAYGDNFVPECGGVVAIVLKPIGTQNPVQLTLVQVTLIEFPSVCDPVLGYPETAWSAGYDFGGSNWAKYFIYCIK
ncbi:MAG: hypothetical protein WBJ37_01240 [Bacteroidales bacterium]